MCLYIFLIYNIYHLCCLCIDFNDLSACFDCWFVVYVRRFIYKFLNVCSLDNTVVAGREKVRPVNQLTTPVRWLKLLQLTVLSRSIIAVLSIMFWFVGVVISPFDISVGIVAFVLGLCQISEFSVAI